MALNPQSRTTLKRGDCWNTAQNKAMDTGANRSTAWRTGKEDFTVNEFGIKFKIEQIGTTTSSAISILQKKHGNYGTLDLLVTPKFI